MKSFWFWLAMFSGSCIVFGIAAIVASKETEGTSYRVTDIDSHSFIISKQYANVTPVHSPNCWCRHLTNVPPISATSRTVQDVYVITNYVTRTNWVIERVIESAPIVTNRWLPCPNLIFTSTPCSGVANAR